MEKGILTNREYLIAGKLQNNEGQIYMSKPTMVIGSDKAELMEFLGRRREKYYLNMRGFVKLSLLATLVHILVFRIPNEYEKLSNSSVN